MELYDLPIPCELQNEQNQLQSQHQSHRKLHDNKNYNPNFNYMKQHSGNYYDTPYEPHGANKEMHDDSNPYEMDIYDNTMYGSSGNIHDNEHIYDPVATEESPANLKTPRKPPRIFADCPEFEICENEIYNQGLGDHQEL